MATVLSSQQVFLTREMYIPANNIQREIIPLSQGNCLLVFDREKSKFDFPIHFHPEFELNFIYYTSGAERIIGDHKILIGETELVVVEPNIYHGWNNA